MKCKNAPQNMGIMVQKMARFLWLKVYITPTATSVAGRTRNHHSKESGILPV